MKDLTLEEYTTLRAYVTHKIGTFSPSIQDALIHFEGNYNHETLKMAKVCDTYQEYCQSQQFQTPVKSNNLDLPV